MSPARARSAGAVATIVLLAGPARALPPAPPTAHPPPPTRRPAPTVASRCELRVGQVYQGSYVCAQGPTTLALRVLEVRGDAVRAQFDFDWVRGGIRGSFTLAGTCDPATRVWAMAPERWLAQPPDWMMVGMRGVLSAGARVYQGRMQDPNCGDFDVAR